MFFKLALNKQSFATTQPLKINLILQELVAEIDSNEQLDEDVEDMLLTIADDFIDNLGKCSKIVYFWIL